jgi:protease-4
VWHTLNNLEQSVAIDGGVLVWKVAGQYPEERDDSFWGQIRNGGELTLSEVVFSLHRAAADDRITGLVMELQSLGTDWAKLDELREAVSAFQAAGKPVIAYFDGAGTREYALACQADRIVASPEANLMILGISAELAFMKDTLDKLGMEADFVHVGAYKSAPERMTRTSASAANREMISSIVDDRYEALRAMLAASRQVSIEEVDRWINQGMFDGPAALAAGLVDTLQYYDDVFDEHFGDDEVTFLEDYQLSPPKQHHTSHKVAVVQVTGVIMPGESRFDRFQGKLAGSETVVEQLQSVADDDDVDAVILRIDSPGGSALASDLVWNEIRKVQVSKPVIVSMSGLAASGGYYIACLGDSVFADAGTLTGSIGVYAGKMSRTGMYEKVGVNREFITRGDNALLFTDEGGFTAPQRKLFQAQLDGFYERFLGKVADGRDMSRDEVHAIAQGRVWTGRQGLDNGLVDAIGGLRRAIDSAKWMVGLQPADKVTLVTFSKPLSLLERILIKSMRDNGIMARLASGPGPEMFGPGTGSTALGAAVPLLLDALRRDGTLAAVALMDGRPVAMLPFWINLN